MSWRVQVLGGLALSQGSRVITHFESGRVAALLACLALFTRHPHPREELVERLWPESDPEQGRHRLRQALYSLRQQLEPPGTMRGSVLIADRQTVRLHPDAFTCDAIEFEGLARQGRGSEACALYVGELLPGFYDEWILRERERLVELRERLPALPILPISSDPLAPPPVSTLAAAPAASGIVFLPTYLSEFLGRSEEQALLRAHLASRRLLTITGMGGVGKTRLAVETARAAAADSSAAYSMTAFASLADCAAPWQIFDAVRAALHLPASALAPLDQIAYVLADHKTLLVLDNFEHLVDEGGAEVLETLLARLPGLTCLVTSRRLPGVAGEQEFPLAPLPLPHDDDTLAEAAQCPGLALFVHRAQAARPGFQLTEANRADVSALCRALDGLPLALELAAARIRALSPSEMRRQLQDRFQWLARSGPGADKEPRQRSLQNALEWSWRLLFPPQQRFLAALSIFRGGWTAPLAAQVRGIEDARERLENLVMDSLVVSEETPSGATRFRMLETVRVWAAGRLDDHTACALSQRHQAAFLKMAQRASGNDHALCSETDNLLAALSAAIENEEANAAFALCVAIDESWMALVGASVALTWLQRALHLSGGDTRARLKTIHLAGYLALMAGDTAQAHALADLAETVAQTAGNAPAERVYALLTRCGVALTCAAPAPDTRACLEEVTALAQSAGELRVAASALRLMGIQANRDGEHARAEQSIQEALRAYEAIHDGQGVLYALDGLASVAVNRNDLERAAALYEDCHRRAEAIGNTVYEAKVYQNLATVYARQERWEDSLATGLECVRRNHAMGNTYILVYALWNLAEPLVHLGQAALAARLLSFAACYWAAHYSPLTAEDDSYCALIRARVATASGDASTDALWRAGGKLTLAQAAALALAV